MRCGGERRLAAVIAVTATLAGGARLHAAPRDPKAVARAKLVEGAQLLSRGDYEEALARFQEAYASVPSPKIFYNYGLANKGLGRNADVRPRLASGAVPAPLAAQAVGGRGDVRAHRRLDPGSIGRQRGVGALLGSGVVLGGLVAAVQVGDLVALAGRAARVEGHTRQQPQPFSSPAHASPPGFRTGPHR